MIWAFSLATSPVRKRSSLPSLAGCLQRKFTSAILMIIPLSISLCLMTHLTLTSLARSLRGKGEAAAEGNHETGAVVSSRRSVGARRVRACADGFESRANRDTDRAG